MSVFLCVLFCIPECLYVCVYSCGLKAKKEEGADLYQEKRYGLWPAAFGTKGLLLLCMLAVSVGDKAWSWEIRSGPANETHAKGLHGKPPLSTPHFNFEAFLSLRHITPLSTTCLSVHWYEQTNSHRFITSDPLPAAVTFSICMNESWNDLKDL